MRYKTMTAGLLLLSLVMPAPIHALEESKGKTTSFTVHAQGGWVLLPVMVDGKGPISIVFDTGATDSYINPSVYRRHGLKQGSKTIAIGNFTFTTSDFPIDSQDIPLVDGIMGYDVISQFVCELDIRNRQLTFHERKTWKQPADDAKSTTRKIKYITKQVGGVDSGMALNVTVNGKGPLHLLVDTGCPAACALLKSSSQKVGLAPSNQPIMNIAVKVADGIETKSGVVLNTPFPGLEQARQVLPDLEGVLGGNFLKDFIVTFDVVNKELLFRTPK